MQFAGAVLQGPHPTTEDRGSLAKEALGERAQLRPYTGLVDPFDFLQLSIVTDDADVCDRQCERTMELVEQVQALAEDRFKWAVVFDVDGHDTIHVRGKLRKDDLWLGDRHSAIAELHPRDAVRWSPPLFSVGATRRGRYGYETDWSVLASGISEEFYCEAVRSQVEQLLLEKPFIAGFAGPSPFPSTGTPNSPFFASMKVGSGQVNFRESLAGAHWLNLVPGALLDEATLESLREIGAEVAVGPSLTAIRLCESPSNLTDELVLKAMTILDHHTHGETRSLAPDWWRLSNRDSWPQRTS